MPPRTAMLQGDALLVQLVETDLGWMAVSGADGRVCQLNFGYATPDAALSALGLGEQEFRVEDWFPKLSRRLRRYARGEKEDLSDVPLAERDGTEFRRAVLRACRAVPRGQTTTYAELAQRCGRPRAARAVGNFMATNRTPLVIPCHRVLAASGRLGGFSAPGGLGTKLRLLEMEGAAIPSDAGLARREQKLSAVLFS